MNWTDLISQTNPSPTFEPGPIVRSSIWISSSANPCSLDTAAFQEKTVFNNIKSNNNNSLFFLLPNTQVIYSAEYFIIQSQTEL